MSAAIIQQFFSLICFRPCWIGINGVCLFAFSSLGGAIGAAAPITNPKKRQTKLHFIQLNLQPSNDFTPFVNYGWGGNARQQLHFFFQLIRKSWKEKKWKFVEWAAAISLLHQSKKPKFCFFLFPQHRYTYCYNIFYFHSFHSTKWNENKSNKRKFTFLLLDLVEWNVVEWLCWPFIHQSINWLKIAGSWL